MTIYMYRHGKILYELTDHNLFQTLVIYMYKYSKNGNLFQLDNDKKLLIYDYITIK